MSIKPATRPAFIFSLILLLIFSGSLFAGQQKVHDIRILIDVSGSMKKNDPAKLRQPALRLISSLIPDNSRAGVWTFARQVNMLVPIDTVSAGWKKEAHSASRTIESHGLFTDIEATMHDATWDWNRPDQRYNRIMILLTDGLVDVSKDNKKDEISRKRILGKIAPRLKKANARVFTIALSDHADVSLLQQISEMTSGRFEKVQDASRLERIFLHMFEQSAQPDTVPLAADNTFRIDKSIREMTLLVFRRNGAPGTRLISPGGMEYDSHAAAGQRMSWHQDERFDLITIKQPETGQWGILADTDPDNRVMVVTDLKLVTNTPPGNILAGDRVDLNVSLTEKDKLITRAEFHDFISVEAFHRTSGSNSYDWLLPENGKKLAQGSTPGVYALPLKRNLKKGGNEIMLHANGTTFERSLRHNIRVHTSPATVSILPSPDNENMPGSLVLTPIGSLIVTERMQAMAVLTNGDGGQTETEMERYGPGEWRLDLANNDLARYTQASIRIRSLRPDGQPFSGTIGPVNIQTAGTATAKNEADTGTVAANPTQVAPNHDRTQDELMTEEPLMLASWSEYDTGEPKSPLSRVIVQVVLFNSLLLVLLGLIYRKWRSRRAAGPLATAAPPAPKPDVMEPPPAMERGTPPAMAQAIPEFDTDIPPGTPPETEEGIENGNVDK